MFSQYSWWDFFKVVITLAIPYYGYVAWKYYREDIRELISNRGQRSTPQPAVEEEDEDDESLFAVSHYESVPSTPKAPSASATHEPKLKPGQWLPEVAETTSPVITASRPIGDESAAEPVDLQGPAVAESAVEGFSLPLGLQTENPQELSLELVIDAAGRISPNDEGIYAAVVVNDEPAQRVATVINNQQGRAVFADFPFNR